MSKIDPPAGWPDVDVIDVFERVLGGASGPLNRAEVALTARTKFLRDNMLTSAQLAANDGATKVGFIQAGADAVGRTLQSKTREQVTLEDFGALADGTNNDMPALVRALAAGYSNVRFVPGRTYKLAGSVAITTAGMVFDARGATILLGDGLLAGAAAIRVQASNFLWAGGTLRALARVKAIEAQVTTAILESITVAGVEFHDFFYDVWASGNQADSFPVRDFNVLNCKGFAPTGQNSGRAMAIYADGITYMGNRAVGALNSSAFGAANCRNVVMVGNRERGVVDSVNVVEAALQIEGYADGFIESTSRSIIVGNVCEHDIWVSDSSEVTVNGNTCRRLRLTLGNPSSQGSYRNTFTGNAAAQILCGFYGPTTTENVSADFIGNVLSSAGRTINGAAISSSISIDGGAAALVRFIGNRIASPAETYAVSLVRAAGMRLQAFDNDLGTLPHIISGSGGTVYERNNQNALYDAANGYITVAPAGDVLLSLATWVPLSLGTALVNVNAEFDTSTSTFTPAETGVYQFQGGALISFVAAGDGGAIRLFDTTAPTDETCRLAHAIVGGAGFQKLGFSFALRLLAGRGYQLQVFNSGSSPSTLLGGSILSQVQISRLQ